MRLAALSLLYDRRFYAFAALLICLSTMTNSSVYADQTTEQKGAKPLSNEGTDDASKEEPEPPLNDKAQKALEQMRSTLPEGSEARAMLESLATTASMGPEDGWFPLAQAVSRFPWEMVQSQYDTNRDQSINLQEFGGSRKDFAAIDRDDNHQITADDFDWSEHALTRTPGALLFSQADRDANGKLTQQELIKWFQRHDRNHHGFLALNDLKDQLLPASNAPSAPRADAPSKSTLILALQKQELGSLQSGPQLDAPAPNFTLPSVDRQSFTLSDYFGKKPIVLIFGNFTCGPFRSQAGNLEKLYTEYQDRAQFFMVYVREAHPSDGWWMESNQRVGIEPLQPKTDEERQKIAVQCQKHLDLTMPFLIDSVDDRVGAVYSGMPNRLYLIDLEGKVAFKNGRGPFGFHTRQLEQALVLMLQP